MRLEPHRLILLDETGTTTKMTRLRGRCPKGQRFRCKAPFGHRMTQTLVAGLRCDKLTAPFVVNAQMVPAHLRNLCRKRARPNPRQRRCRHRGQSASPSKAADATSILDYIFHELAISYLGCNDLAHVDPSDIGHDVL
jgi:hypothetical protein